MKPCSLRSVKGVASGTGLPVLALCLGLLLASTWTHGTNVYKWTDSDGEVHYSDQPPPDSAAEKLRIETHTDDTAAQRLRQLEATAEANRQRREQAKAEAAEAAREQEKIAAHCREARARYDQLKNARRPQYINEQGEREFIVEEQRETWLRAAQAELAKHCKD